MNNMSYKAKGLLGFSLYKAISKRIDGWDDSEVFTLDELNEVIEYYEKNIVVSSFHLRQKFTELKNKLEVSNANIPQEKET